MSCLTAQVNAASGDSTVSLGFAHIRFPGLKDFVRDAGVYNRDTFRNVVNVNHFNSSAEYENAIARGHDGTAKSPLGMSIRYRYEITDELGVIASFTWARSMTNAQAFIDVKPSDPSREVKTRQLQRELISGLITGVYYPVLRGGLTNASVCMQWLAWGLQKSPLT